MKKLSLQLLSETVVSKRKAAKLTQAQLAEKSGMNRSMLSKMESGKYVPSVNQLELICDTLDIDITDLFVDEHKENVLKR